MSWERGDQGNSVPLFLGCSFSDHWLLPRRCSATLLLLFLPALAAALSRQR